MNFYEAIVLTEAKGDKLLLLDIDDTIVRAKNIYIYKKEGNKEIKLSPKMFAKEKITNKDANKYDFREFKNAEKVSSSIKSGEPIIKVLKYMDKMIEKGYDIGILTARGMEDVIKDTLQSWLMYERAGKLYNIGQKLKEVFAINDILKKYEGVTDFEKKANIIKALSSKYNQIVFVDDDKKNIDAVQSLNLKNVESKIVGEIE